MLNKLVLETYPPDYSGRIYSPIQTLELGNWYNYSLYITKDLFRTLCNGLGYVPVKARVLVIKLWVPFTRWSWELIGTLLDIEQVVVPKDLAL